MNKLSEEFEVACAVYRATEVEDNSSIGLTELTKRLPTISKADIGMHLLRLRQHEIVKGQYGALPGGRAGMCYSIDIERNGGMVQEVYQKFYRKEAQG